jgi:hypothetical protein
MVKWQYKLRCSNIGVSLTTVILYLNQNNIITRINNILLYILKEAYNISLSVIG